MEGGAPSNGITMHRDFDVGVYLEEGTAGDVEAAMPNISTITYLTSSIAAMPTVIFSDLSLAQSEGSYWGATHEAWAIFPAAGKHVSFLGSLWHGVPPAAICMPGGTAARRVGRSGARRVTLLVNVWLDRIPRIANAPRAGAAAIEQVAVPPLSFEEVPRESLEQWRQCEHPSGAWSWVRGSDGSSAGDSHTEEAGTLALPLFADVDMHGNAETKGLGIKLWLPPSLVRSGSHSGARASRIVFSGAGQQLEYAELGAELRASDKLAAGTGMAGGDVAGGDVAIDPFASDLFGAAYHGDTQLVRLLVAGGAPLDRTDRRGLTPLMYAARLGHSEVVSQLLDAGMGVDERSSGGMTVLHHAASSAAAATSRATIRELLRRGASHEVVDEQGMSCLHAAAEAGNAAAAEALLAAGAVADAREPRGATALHLASSAGNAAVAEALLRGGASVNAIGAGVSPLHLAASGGHTATVRVLLNGGADADAVASNGATSLHLAGHRGSMEVASLLVDAGAARDRLDARGDTPEALALQSGHEEVAALIGR